MKNKKSIKFVALLISIGLIAALIVLGAIVFSDRAYVWISLVVTILACLPFFIGYEKRSADAGRLSVLAAMTALSVLGRFLFAPIPHFKPISAMVIICGMYLGAESGFMCGALSAITSNILFGQGPWTPFQMLSWGLIGLFSGVFSKILKKHRILLLLCGALAGVAYSLLMDIWSTIEIESGFSLSRYLALAATALPVTVVYAVSNVIFLSLLAHPIGKKLERMEKKGII